MLNLKYIKYQIHDDGIAFINLNRNPVNAFNLILLEELDEVINDIKDNSKCKLIIFSVKLVLPHLYNSVL